MLWGMATAINTHAGPWTEEDLVALPTDGQRYELLEGTLLVSPPPAFGHQRVSFQLARALDTCTPADLVVVEAVGVRLPEGSVLVPDVLVVEKQPALADRSGILDPRAVRLVVEIVSPGSRTTDRFTKPAVYARAGIGYFWRVELEDGPVIAVYRLEGHDYVAQASAGSGEQLIVEDPFPVSIDPAALTP